MNLSKEVFFELELKLRSAGFASESKMIKSRILNKENLSADEFARRAIYVVLVSGFRQKTAKIIHGKIMDFLHTEASETKTDDLTSDLFKIFGNRKKINAVADIWKNRVKYRDGYYALESKPLETKLLFLSQLPHIGPITKNHLARNLGEDVVKYDIWIQRLGVAFEGKKDLESKINNGNLHPLVKKACDKMFEYLKQKTGLPLGYIDYVLWRACEQHIFIPPKMVQSRF